MSKQHLLNREFLPSSVPLTDIKMDNSRPAPVRNASADSATVPELTHQDSFDSVKSPITPGPNETSKSPFSDNSEIKEPQSAPATTTTFHNGYDSDPKLPSKNLPFLQNDPYADDDVIPFDKNKPIVPSRKGSVRSILSRSSSIGSIRSGLGSLKRKLSRKGGSRRERKPKPEFELPPRQGTLLTDAHTFRGPARVETYQISSMAY